MSGGYKLYPVSDLIDELDGELAQASVFPNAEHAARQEAIRELLEILEDESGINPRIVNLIRVDQFIEYTRELAWEQVGRDLDSWPLCHIDWQKAADDLAGEFFEVTFLDADYYYQ